MAKTKKRILSLAMALVMVFTLLPTAAFAKDKDEEGIEGHDTVAVGDEIELECNEHHKHKWSWYTVSGGAVSLDTDDVNEDDMDVTGVTAGTVWVYCGHDSRNGKLITVKGSGGQTGKSVEVIFYVHQENMGTYRYECSGVTFSDGSPIRPGNSDSGKLYPVKDYVVILNNNRYWSINATDTDNDGAVSADELKAYLQNNPSAHPNTASAKSAVEAVAYEYEWTLNFDLNGYKDGDEGIQVGSVAWNLYDQAFHVDLELQPKTFDIVFHGEGGTYNGNETKTESWTYTPAGYEVPSNDKDFDYEGYEFDEWALAEGSSLEINENGKIYAAQDFDLYANWTEKQYTINYQMDPSGVGSLTRTTETVNAVTGDGPQGSTAGVTDDTYEFLGWFDGTTQVGTDLRFVPSSRETATYTAKFAKKQTYSVTVSGDSHVTSPNASPSSVYAGGSSTVTWSVEDGYVTDKVTVNSVEQSGITGNSLTISNISENKTVSITTKGAPTSYTVEYYYEGADGYLSTATSTSSARTGERFASVSVTDADKTPASDKSGYEFDTTNVNNVLSISSLTTANNVLKVYFKLKTVPYSITLNFRNREGTVIGTDSTTYTGRSAKYGTSIDSLVPDALKNVQTHSSLTYQYDAQTGAVSTSSGTALTVDNTVINLYYDVDNLDKDSPTTPGSDGVPDKNQIVFEYVAEAAEPAKGTVTGTTKEIVNKDAVSGNASPTANVTVSANSGYAFKYWTNSANSNVDVDSVMSTFQTVSYSSDTTFTACFGADVIGGKDGDGNDTGDQIPDDYQVVVNYVVASGCTGMGGVNPAYETINLRETENGAYKTNTDGSYVLKTKTALTGKATPTDGYIFSKWTNASGDTNYPADLSTIAADGQMAVQPARTYTLTAHFAGVSDVTVSKVLVKVVRGEDTLYDTTDEDTTNNEKPAIRVGDTLTWTITVSNNGTAAATGLSLRDTLADATVTPVTTGVSADNFTVPAKTANVPGKVEFTATYVVKDSDKGKTLTNSVTVNGTGQATTPTGEDKNDVPYLVTVNYVDEEGTALKASITTPATKDGTTGSYSYSVTPDAITNYVYEWPAVDSAPLAASSMTGDVTVTLVYTKDEKRDPNLDLNGDKPGDGIPDKYQYTVTYKATNGKVSISSTVVTKLNNDGQPSAEGTAKLAANQVATATANSGYRQSSLTWSPKTPVAGLEITADTTFTAKFSSIPVYDDDDDDDDKGKDIKDPEVPLGGLQLNKDDHFAYIKGYADGTVRPNNFITRAQVATIFYRLMTDETRMLCFSETNDFSDVPADYWANKAISTLSNAGIITGFSDGTFRPNAYITRAQFAAIAARFSVVTEDLPNPFSDVPEGYWAEDLIAYAAHLGWVNGYPDGTFRPTANITRAAAMKLINNVLERQVDEDGLLEDATQWNDCAPDDWCYYIVMEATNSHDWERRSKKSLVEDWTALTADPVWDE